MSEPMDLRHAAAELYIELILAKSGFDGQTFGAVWHARVEGENSLDWNSLALNDFERLLHYLGGLTAIAHQ